ncbi:DUF2004 domain-containing protein [uncultured Ruminococcus sp.]|uniref:DUF6985 domain-containing protein n=1 Tax=uncultured Ruminococcus sp. TaxID=165186 RepID=UPI0025E36DD5|nr:DUF2004 domain-containing protein [uncultured Ruminococcus sp.]
MINSVFGELTYEYGWNGKTTIDWYGEMINVDLVVSGEEDEEIDSLQCESYEKFKLAWSDIKDSILERVLSYYINLRNELGYGDDSNENYPAISNIDEIKNIITLDSIVVPLSGVYDGRSIALAFHCEWDAENGLGIILVNEEIHDIGYQDIAF